LAGGEVVHSLSITALVTVDPATGAFDMPIPNARGGRPG
jgi:hypothetical protein